jgi:hypothetical protein
VLNLVIPAVGLAGCWAVVPLGNFILPVVATVVDCKIAIYYYPIPAV